MKKIKKLYYNIIYKLGKMKMIYYFKDEWLGAYAEYLKYKDKYFEITPNYCRGSIHGLILEEIKKKDMPKYSIERDFFENITYYDINGKEIKEKRIESGLNKSNDEAYKLKQRLGIIGE